MLIVWRLVLTPTLPHGTHNPSTLWVSVCLHQGKLESGLRRDRTYSTRDIPRCTWGTGKEADTGQLQNANQNTRDIGGS